MQGVWNPRINLGIMGLRHCVWRGCGSEAFHALVTGDSSAGCFYVCKGMAYDQLFCMAPTIGRVTHV
jgi:hypothetical protein